MENILIQATVGMVTYVWNTLIHNWPSLVLGMVIAIVIKLYLAPDKMRQWLLKSAKVSIPASVAFGAFTPFCACGTMAIIVAMMSTALPWGPVMAFLTSSPLMSPEKFVMLAGIIGMDFAVALTLASIAIGMISGILTTWIETNTTWLDGQARFADKATHSSPQPSHSLQMATACCGASGSAGVVAIEMDTPYVFATSAPGAAPSATCSRPSKWKEALDAFVEIGLKQILLLFSIFAGIGYLINTYVPQEWIIAAFDGGHPWAVPLAALVGMPLYVSGASSIPLIDTFMGAGASSGAILAFMITGPGTSMGAMTGIMTIMKKRALGLYIAFLYIGAVGSGLIYDAIIAAGLIK